MHEGTEAQRDQIIRNLEMLNEQVREQRSVWHVFRNGLIYGVGFIAGSTILTAIAVSVVIRFFDGTLLSEVVTWIVER